MNRKAATVGRSDVVEEPLPDISDISGIIDIETCDQQKPKTVEACEQWGGPCVCYSMLYPRVPRYGDSWMQTKECLCIMPQ